MPLYLAITIVIGLGLIEQYAPWLRPFGLTIPLAMVGVVLITVARPQFWLLSLLAGLLIDITNLTPFGVYAIWYLLTGAVTHVLSQRYPKHVTWIIPPVTGVAIAFSTISAGLLSAPVFWSHVSIWMLSALIRASEATLLTLVLLLPRLRHLRTPHFYESRTILR